MRRLFFLLAFMLAPLTAQAASLSYFLGIYQTCGGGNKTSCATVTVPASAQVGQILWVHTSIYGGASAATSPTFTVNGTLCVSCQVGTTETQNKTVVAVFKKTLIAGDPGSTISVSWTNNNSATVTPWIITPSDNGGITVASTNITGKCGANAASCTPGAITPAQNGDLVFESCAFGGGGNPTFDNTPFPSTATSGVETSGFLGWSGTSGAAVMTQASQHVGGAIYDIACFAADIEATSAGEVLVGAGADTAVSSSTTVSPPTLAANVHSGDVHIAGIAELTPGATITAPPDIVQRYAPTYVTGTGNQTFTISSATVVNDFFTVAFGNGAVMSAPAACGSDAWQSLATSGSFIGAFGKIIDSCDISHSYTFTGSSGGVNQGIADFASNSGATISKDTATCGSIASTANPSVPAITTGTDNDTIYSFLFGQASATTPVPPAANIVLWQNNGSAAAGGLYQQGAHGSTGAQAYTTPGSAQTWLYCHVALKTNTAAASPWTHQTSALANESNSVQLDTYSAHGLPANVLEQFHFSASQSTADALIVDVGNLNTTTPVDSSGTLKNEGLANDMTAAIQAPTASDDLALSFMAYSGCSPTLATQGEQIAPAVTLGNKLAAFFMPIDFATTAQVVGSCGGPWASATEGLQSVSAPTQTSAAVRLQYDSETIFSLAPAPLPPTNGGWPF